MQQFGTELMMLEFESHGDKLYPSKSAPSNLSSVKVTEKSALEPFQEVVRVSSSNGTPTFLE